MCGGNLKLLALSAETADDSEEHEPAPQPSELGGTAVLREQQQPKDVGITHNPRASFVEESV